MNIQQRPVGEHLRAWRQRRRKSQLDLACQADISTRHLSFVETGRALPSREMILHLAEELEIPMRERNLLLVSAGYAPMFPERPLDDPAMRAARVAIDLMLEGQKPYPAFAIDRHWQTVATNAALPIIYEGVAEHLLEPPVNGMRLTLHPDGMASRIVNIAEWREHMLSRLKQQVEITADPVLIDLLAEVSEYPAPETPAPSRAPSDPPIIMPFKIRTSAGVLSLFTTTMVFGSPVDITLSELAIECCFAADAETDAIVRRLSQS
ncbi:MAG TPA: helix-turn-helix transcriptional regulator [Rhizomicrobium sp.]|nr:helix-turn-helix transcriptional regulator [Rhizomicrobium sp.]